MIKIDIYGLILYIKNNARKYNRGVYMKRIIKLLVVMAVAVVILAFAGTAALASDYNAQADALNEMGLFLGTDKGYELDRIPTRAEAAVMLVRLLGKEDEAKAGTYDTPFTDIPDWAAHAVGYMYANNLTKGTGATTFGCGDICSEQMFAAFVLRALGYNESSGDFTFAQAQEYAENIGLIEHANTPDQFKRDDMVALSYSALFQLVKNGSTTLLEKLISERVVEAAAADRYLSSYETYKDLLKASEKTNSATGIQLSNDTEIQLGIDGQTQTITQKMELAAVMSGNDYKMKIDTTAALLGTPVKLAMYYADGWMYMDMGIAKYKFPYTLDTGELEEFTQQSGIGEVDNPFYLIDSIIKTVSATGVTYQVIFAAAAVNDLLDSILSQALEDMEGAAIQVNKLETVYAFDMSGNLQSIAITGDIGMVISDGQETETIGITLRSTTKVIATGSSVNVTPPADLTSYLTIINPGI